MVAAAVTECLAELVGMKKGMADDGVLGGGDQVATFHSTLLDNIHHAA